jgi:hypothetical protein
MNENIATPEYGAKVIHGKVYKGSLATNLLSGIMDNNSDNYTYHYLDGTRGIITDLGEPKNFNRIRILPHRHPDSKYRYVIDVKNNGDEWWKTIAETTNRQNKENPWHEYKFGTINAQYIKIAGYFVSHHILYLQIVSLEVYYRSGT